MSSTDSTPEQPSAPTPGWPIRKLRELLGLDLRSLALFRIGLGTLILVDLAIRSM